MKIYLDSKNKKGKDVLFNQQYFIKMNELPNLNTNLVKVRSKKLHKSLGKVRSTSKNKFNGQYFQTGSTIKAREGNSRDKILNNYYMLRNQNNLDKNGFKTMNSESKINYINTNANLVTRTLNSESSTIFNKDDIILNQRVLQRFFAYFVLDFYSKYFKTVKISEDNKDDISLESENIYKQNNKQGNSPKKSNNKKNSKKNKGNTHPTV